MVMMVSRSGVIVEGQLKETVLAVIMLILARKSIILAPKPTSIKGKAKQITLFSPLNLQNAASSVSPSKSS